VFNICPQCGEYAEEKQIDPAGPFAICPHCSYAHPFLQQPLFIVTGASGAGKSAVCLALVPILQECVVLDSDILWGIIPATAEDNYRSYRNAWLRLAKNIGQAGRPVVLFGSAIPEQFESCAERRYFSTLHGLALVCEDEALLERLKQRPAWRKSSSAEALEGMVQFNCWLREHAPTTQPPMTLYDTTNRSIPETVGDIARWIRQRLTA
jgi:broad-specificity NMP kinase